MTARASSGQVLAVFATLAIALASSVFLVGAAAEAGTPRKHTPETTMNPNTSCITLAPNQAEAPARRQALPSPTWYKTVLGWMAAALRPQAPKLRDLDERMLRDIGLTLWDIDVVERELHSSWRLTRRGAVESALQARCIAQY